MKITKTPPKNQYSQPPPRIQELIKFVSDEKSCDEEHLIDSLTRFREESWPYPRGDLYSWIPVLNRFDKVLECLTNEYKLEEVQATPFSPAAAELLLSILRFSSFLLSHCANRALYSSSTHLDKLLNSTNLDVLEATLELLLHIVQKAATFRKAKQLYSISQERLLRFLSLLPQEPTKTGTAQNYMTLLFDEKVPSTWSSLYFTYYASTSSPTKEKKGKDGMVGFRIDSSRVLSEPTESLIHGIVAEKHLPKPCMNELLVSIISRKAFPKLETRRQMVRTGLLALANAVYAHYQVVQSRFLLFDPEIMNHLASLIPQSVNLSQDIKGVCFECLKAFLFKKNMVPSVLAALNVSVSYGLLMNLVRDFTTTIQTQDSNYSREFVDSFYDFLQFLCTSSLGGNMACSAGLASLLGAHLDVTTPHVSYVVARSINLLDHLIDSYTMALPDFSESKGLEMLVKRLDVELKTCIDLVEKGMGNTQVCQTMDYAIPYDRYFLLKNMLKFILHLIQSGGSVVELRNLIDSSLITSLTYLFQHAESFGSTLFASATNIMSTFIHNEPTCYGIIQENGLSGAFLDATNRRIFTSPEAITSIPLAFGAICLNTEGMNLFLEKNPLPKFFSIFTSLPHCKSLVSSDSTVMLGNYIDELMRHQPSLKEPIINFTGVCINDLKKFLDAYSPFDYIGNNEPPHFIHIETFMSFLENVVANEKHGKIFMEKKILNELLDLVSHPSLAFGFFESPIFNACYALLHHLKVMDAIGTFRPILEIISKSIDELSLILDSKFLAEMNEALLSHSPMSESVLQATIKLAILNNMTALFSELLSSSSAPHKSGALSTIQLFTSPSKFAGLLWSLGSMKKLATLGDVLLCSTVSNDYVICSAPLVAVFSDKEKRGIYEKKQKVFEEDSDFVRFKNVRSIYSQMAVSISKLMSALSRVLVGFKPLDHTHKKASYQVGASIASVVKDFITLPTDDITSSLSEVNFLKYFLANALDASIIVKEDDSKADLQIFVGEGLIENGGINTLTDSLLSLFELLRKNPDASYELNGLLVGCIATLLKTSIALVDYKSVSSSNQAGALSGHPRAMKNAGAFDSAGFVVRVKSIVFPKVLSVCRDSYLPSYPRSVLQPFISLICSCFRSEDIIKKRFSGRRLQGDASNSVETRTEESSVDWEDMDVNAETEDAMYTFDESDDASERAQIQRQIAAVNQLVPELQKSFDDARTDLLNMVVSVCKKHGSLTHELTELLFASCGLNSTQQEHITTTVFKDIQQLYSEQSPASLLSMTLLLQLLSLFINYERVSSQIKQQLVQHYDFFISLLKPTKEADKTLDVSMPWLVPLCYIIESILCNQRKPTELEFQSPEIPIRLKEKLEEIGLPKLKLTTSYLIELLNLPSLNLRLSVCVFRILSVLTMNENGALEFVNANGLFALFATMRRFAAQCNETLHTPFISILRNLLECEKMIEEIIYSDVRTYFKLQSRAKKTELLSFIRTNSEMVLRSPTAILNVIKNHCHLTNFSPYASHYFIGLNEDDLKDELPQSTLDSSKSSEWVMKFLVEELLSVGSSDYTKSEEKFDSHTSGPYIYHAFLLQCLTELLSSYASCKEFFISYKPEKSWDSSITKRYPSYLLAYFLEKLLPFGCIHLTEDVAVRKAFAVSNWAISSLVFLCSYTSEQEKSRVDVVRKEVISHIAKSLKTPMSQHETQESYYCRLLVLTELSYRLADIHSFSQRSTNFLLRQSQDQNLRSMVELGFIPILTNVVTDIDLNFPASRKVVRHILKPLQLLTKESVVLSQTNPELFVANSNASNAPDHAVEEVESSSSEDSSDMDREEPPDLYRNSVLGIFQGDIAQNEEDGYEDSEDEELYDDMEYDDEASGSAGSAISEDEADDTMFDEDGEEMNIDFINEDEDSEGEESVESFDSDGEVVDELISIDSDDLDEDVSSQGSEYDDNVSDFVEDFSDEHQAEDIEVGETTFDALEDVFTESSEDEDDTRHDVGHLSPVEIDFVDNPEDSFSDDDEFRWSWPTEGNPSINLSAQASNILQDLIPLPGISSRRVMIINPSDSGHKKMFSLTSESEELLRHPLLLELSRTSQMKYNKFSYVWTVLQDHVPSGTLFQRIAYLLSEEFRNSEVTQPWHALYSKKQDDPLRAISGFLPLSTLQRWNSVSVMLYGRKAASVASRVFGSIMDILLPAAMEAEKKEEMAERAKEAEIKRQPEVSVPSVETQNQQESRQPETPPRTVTSAPAEAQVPARPPAMVTVGGREIDVSPLGIDVTFLEALPEEMREEVVYQRIQERYLASVTDPSEQLDPSFLQVLPLELREDLLFQESVQNRLLEMSANNAADVDEPVVEETDSMDIPEVETASTTKKKPAAEKKLPVPSLLDRFGPFSLIRLLFVPQNSSKNQLYDVVINVCENKQHRAELVGLILYLLQEASVNDQSAEKSYKELTLRSLGLSHVKELKKNQKPVDALCTMPVVAGVSTPSLLLQQCVDLLVHLANWADHFPSFFLSLQDYTSLLPKKASAKRNRESGVGRTAPINVLLGLLGRQKNFASTMLMNSYSELLAILTKPLLSLYKAQIAEKPAVEASATTETDKPQAEGSSQDKKEAEVKPKKSKRFQPPLISDDNLRLTASLITTDSCSSRTFQNALSVMFNLCALPRAKDVIGNELLQYAQGYITILVEDLQSLTKNVLAGKDENGLQSSLSPFCPASSAQAKLLRCLKALDYIFERRPKKQESNHVNIAKLLEFYSKLNSQKLWSILSECLTALREKETVTHVSTVLLPLVESLMVICRPVYIDLPEDIRESVKSLMDPLKTLFLTFTEEHKRIINMMVFTTPSLMSGSFSLLVKNPKVLEFENKRNFFQRQLHESAPKEQYPPLNITVRRDQVFLDSYRALHFKNADEVKYSKLNIRFRDEEGVDAGGVTREWLQVLARQMFNPDYALFLPVVGDSTTFHPNRDSAVNPDHLSFFKFTGRIIGKALYDGRLLDCHFSRAVYKQILKCPLSLKDMESLDPDYYKSLVWMLSNNISDIITEEFAVEKDVFGERTIVDLIENGRNIPVTEENKHQYVNLMVNYKLKESVKDQLQSLCDGFYDIIAPQLVQIFNERELELLISGLPEIDIDDWRNNTEYHNYTMSSPQIQWFWRAVRSFDEEERAKLLQFTTGTSKVPLNGFKELEGMSGFQRFNIHKSYGSLQRLPQSHTCFNQLDLPEYESYEQLRSMLLTAINEGSEGFGFA
ncbi:HECT domain-containing protein [Schizosaccharomyces japonicus yFS275]|uniref:HECT-type E3 ubiquitin transferase n=1 Tax=Schizosaccharomyces japonicus (strain yFS275 / FY16936) TaxID=402676 RepID=B6K2A3_SCHJY|nr:HECT domain-containing protein [Schizosaccharomyces japonicus yFS275]EEB07284.1 HECT domain-containing protein [Schizosaccharomyces japonicus yFS275]